MAKQKYDVSAIALAHQREPHFMSCSRNRKLIMRRDENGDFMLFAHDQETVVEMSATDARDFALWVLMANNSVDMTDQQNGGKKSGKADDQRSPYLNRTDARNRSDES